MNKLSRVYGKSGYVGVGILCPAILNYYKNQYPKMFAKI